MVDASGASKTFTFYMQIGLVREPVTVTRDRGELTLTTVKDIACAFVDSKVGVIFTCVTYKTAIINELNTKISGLAPYHSSTCPFPYL